MRTCLYLVGAGHRGRWAVVLLLALAATGVEVLGAVVVFAILAAITSEQSGFDLPVVGDVRDLAPGLGEGAQLALVGVVLGVFFLGRAGVLVAQAYAQYRVAENAGARLAVRLLSGYLALPYSFHMQRNSAELVRNAFDNVQQFAREALVPAVKLVSHLLVVVGLLTVLLVTDTAATLLAVAVLGPFLWLLLRLVLPRVKRLGASAQDASRSSLQTITESLAGWRDVTMLGREGHFVSRFHRERRQLSRAKYLRSTAREVPRVAVETGLVLFILAFLGVSVVVRGGALDALPVLGLFGYVAVRLQPSLNEILVAVNSLRFVGPGLELMREDLELMDAEGVVGGRAEVPRLRLEEAICLEGVHVRWPDAADDALAGVDLRIGAGQFVGVVGATGAGKSTLVDVVLGLVDPREGRVHVDGRDVREHRRAWQSAIGVVHQTVFLLDGTIRANVALGVPPEEVDDAAVARAVSAAQLDGMLAGLPDGLSTMVGEAGVRLSGGQRQRLAIARALYHEPSVLVLDEGTSALDLGTEADVMAALEPLRGQQTIVVVAHRLSTVRACDAVVLMDAGRVVDVAPFADLQRDHAGLVPSVG
ncbi:ABC transporter ATP-binding protein [Pseudokineococcus sp. 1T1Z-3]|uniref:ABC transporter ATP-binding protein n=1 Tax=Pseudokineococcus sp. 1T1Z-3 TaxID=3132745 RepID=UPI0030AA74CD